MPSATMSRQMPRIVESAGPPASNVALTRSTAFPKSSGRKTYAAVAPAVNRYAAKRRRLWFQGNLRIRTKRLIWPGLCPRQDPSSIYEGRQTNSGHGTPSLARNQHPLNPVYAALKGGQGFLRPIFREFLFSIREGGEGGRVRGSLWSPDREVDGTGEMGVELLLGRRLMWGRRGVAILTKSVPFCSILCHFSRYCQVTSD